MANKKLIAGGAASVALAGVMGLGAVSAASQPSGDTLADKIASAFHVDKAKVQTVINQDRSDHRAQMEKDYTAKLDAAVAAKTITGAQKDLIVAKRAEPEKAREANHESYKDKTQAERKAAMDAERTALEKWATDNNIPTNLLMGFGPHGGHGGPPPAGN